MPNTRTWPRCSIISASPRRTSSASPSVAPSRSISRWPHPAPHCPWSRSTLLQSAAPVATPPERLVRGRHGRRRTPRPRRSRGSGCSTTIRSRMPARCRSRLPRSSRRSRPTPPAGILDGSPVTAPQPADAVDQLGESISTPTLVAWAGTLFPSTICRSADALQAGDRAGKVAIPGTGAWRTSRGHTVGRGRPRLAGSSFVGRCAEVDLGSIGSGRACRSSSRAGSYFRPRPASASRWPPFPRGQGLQASASKKKRRSRGQLAGSACESS